MPLSPPVIRAVLPLSAAGACLARHEVGTRDHLAFVARLVILVLGRQRFWVTLLHVWNLATFDTFARTTFARARGFHGTLAAKLLVEFTKNCRKDCLQALCGLPI